MKKYMLTLLVVTCLGLAGCQEKKPQFEEGELYMNEAKSVSLADINAKIFRYGELPSHEMISAYGEFESLMGLNFTSFVGMVPTEFTLTDFYSLSCPDPEIEGKTYKLHDYIFNFSSENGKRFDLSVSPYGVPLCDTVVESDSPVHCTINGATVTGYKFNESFYAYIHYGELDHYIEAQNFTEDEFESLILSITNEYKGTDVILSNKNGDISNILNPADSKFFMELISSDESRYVQTVPNCLMDCYMNVGGIEMQYHSDCGNLVRWDNGKCLTLTADERTQLNEVFGKYMTLGIGKPEDTIGNYEVSVSVGKPWLSILSLLSSEDAEVIGEILLDSSRYVDTVSDCLADYTVRVADTVYSYHSDCGTFNDDQHGKCLKLTETEKERINGIFEKYFPRGYEVVEEKNEVRVGYTSSGSDVPNAYAIPVSDEDSNKLASVFDDESRFTKGTADCLNDCIVAVNGEIFAYHSDCGTFNDNANNRSLTLSDSEKAEVNGILSKYLTLGSNNDDTDNEPTAVQPVEYQSWGLSCEVKNVSPTGLTFIFTQNQGPEFAEFVTGSKYVLEVKDGYGWVEVKPIVDEVFWTEIAYLINSNSSTEFNINWENLYGKLPTGEYRIFKEVLYRTPADVSETRKYYGFFELGESVHPVINDEWGIQFEAFDVTSTGMTLGYMQYGGEHPDYRYHLDHSFWIEKFEAGVWSEVPYASSDFEWIIPTEPLPVINENAFERRKSWEKIYGTLPSGKYRYCNNVIVYNAVETLMKPYYAEFEIVDPWGVNFSAKNVTNEGLTIVCEQKDGAESEELLTGSYYTIEKFVNNSWKKVDYLPHEYDIVWTAEAWIVPENQTVEWHENWLWLYGALEPGQYRIGKNITYWNGIGDSESKMYYAEFEISDPDKLAAEEWGVSLSVGDVTSTGLTVYLTQEGETPGVGLTFEGKRLTDMVTDMSYWLECEVLGEWQKVSYLTADTVPTWSQLPEMIAMDATTNWKLEWQHYYGELLVGKYRIGKVISAKLPNNDIQRFNVYAEFEIK